MTGRATILDGDTIKIAGVKNRLEFIDAPEMKQECSRNEVSWPCGVESKKALQALIRGREVSCTAKTKDFFGRHLSSCTVHGRDINGEMVATGHALAYRKYSKKYVEFEAHAEQHKLGMWSGDFVAPWLWRKKDKQSAPGKCLIKGNINGRGVKLFHSPGDMSYGNTIITESKGERWFCTPEAAVAAGWVPAWRGAGER